MARRGVYVPQRATPMQYAADLATGVANPNRGNIRMLNYAIAQRARAQGYGVIGGSGTRSSNT